MGLLRSVVVYGSHVAAPKMMERVVGGPDREDGLVDDGGAHGRVMCGWSHQEPGQQKSAVPIRKGASSSLERFLFGGFLPPHIGRLSPSSHRGISPSPVGSIGYPMRS